ncbi:MAG: hypothetical protein Q8S73_35930 [Deltaproteobacteria bacterium]|nr:hypothetical protein [Thiobacillus sp.]MDP3219547.1 hypothetical protein [Deltaproteobacteria bacterium]
MLDINLARLRDLDGASILTLMRRPCRLRLLAQFTFRSVSRYHDGGLDGRVAILTNTDKCRLRALGRIGYCQLSS